MTIGLVQLGFWVAAFAVSLGLAVPIGRLLRASWRRAAWAGLAIVGAGAVEWGVAGYVGVEFGPVVVLLIVAPIAEELLKLVVAAPRGATLASAAAVGVGFAAIENGIYFEAALGTGVVAALLAIGTRAVSDPLLHVTGTSLSVQAFRGRVWGLPAAIALHSTWNVLALVVLGLQFDGTWSTGEAAAAVLGASGLLALALWRIRRWPEIPEGDVDALRVASLSPGGSE